MINYNDNKKESSYNNLITYKYKSKDRKRYTNLNNLDDFVKYYKENIDPEWKDRGRALTTTQINKKGYNGFLKRLNKMGYNYNRFVEEGLKIELPSRKYTNLKTLEDFVEFYTKEIDPEWKERGKALTTTKIKIEGYTRFLVKLRDIGYTYNRFVEEWLGLKPTEVKKRSYKGLETLDDFVEFYKKNIDPEWKERGRALTTNELIKREYRSFIPKLREKGYSYAQFIEKGLGFKPNKIKRYKYGGLKTVDDFVEFYIKKIDQDFKDRGRALTTIAIKKKGFYRFLARLREIGYTYTQFVKDKLSKEYSNPKTLENVVKPSTKKIDHNWKEKERALGTTKIKENNDELLKRSKTTDHKHNMFIEEGLRIRPKKVKRHSYKGLKTLEDFVEFYTKEIDPEWKERGKALSTTKIMEKKYSGFLARLKYAGYDYRKFVKEGLGIEPNTIVRHNYTKLKTLNDFVEFYKKNIDPEWKERGRMLSAIEIKEKGYSGFLTRLRSSGYKYSWFIKKIEIEPSLSKRYIHLETLEDFVEFYKKNIDPEWKEKGVALSTTKIVEMGYGGFLERLRKAGYKYKRFVKEGLKIKPNLNGKYAHLETLEDFVEFYKKEIDPEWKEKGVALSTTKIVEMGYGGFLARLGLAGHKYSVLVKEGLKIKPSSNSRYAHLKTLEDFVEFYKKEIDPSWNKRKKPLTTSDIKKMGHLTFISKLKKIGYTYNKFVVYVLGIKPELTNIYRSLKTIDDFVRFYKEKIDPEFEERGEPLTASEIVKRGHRRFMSRLRRMGYDYYAFIRELGIETEPIKKTKTTDKTKIQKYF